MDDEYGRMGRAINEEVFLKLNMTTNNIGTSPKDIEIIIRNFEDHLIDGDIDEFEEFFTSINII